MRKKNYTAVDVILAAKREANTKRPYLLVNPLQGKHVPVRPDAALGLFDALGEKCRKAIAPTETVLAIAFAETATAIGAGLLSFLPGPAYYLQTTREEEAGREYLFFSESHSHATEQRLGLVGLREILERADTILFAEDEVTTGRTIRHLIDALSEIVDLSRKKLWVASLLNGMTKEHKRSFEEASIGLLYLVDSEPERVLEQIGTYAYDGGFWETKETDFGAETQGSVRILKPLRPRCNPRSVVERERYLLDCRSFALETVKRLELKRQERILVLGTEEFMYPGLLLAKELERQGLGEAIFHATTRSPILTSTEPEYPLHNRWRLRSLYEKERITYIYNLECYDQAVVVTDAKPEGIKAGVSSLADALMQAGTKKITLAEWRE